ncbi:PilZ domain-containing protein [Pseudidiomarina taiwanensis]|uniref:Pilus assembly protein PilZ n=1 Tax=Pseudidiomarina taiwanensis TaxID=337250 RepID=A0A432ZNF5_9GAMM|nr:PilZ domain-containing protein [Pseudidiomarina taiwanensis]RUO79406.1 pilus assembly protein PilZ [Pseudidiomarina taiwanensis]
MSTKRLKIESEEQLRRLYMPFIKGGALFIATDDNYQLGDEVKLVLRLPADTEDTLVRSKVVWLAPKRSGRADERGVGVQFVDDKSHLRNRIETMLGHLGESAMPTATM